MEAGVKWKLVAPAVERLARMQLLNCLMKRQNVKRQIKAGAYGDKGHMAHLERRYGEADAEVRAALYLLELARVDYKDMKDALAPSDKEHVERLKSLSIGQ